MRLAYEILSIMNNVLLAVIAVAFFVQIVYVFLFFLPSKKYKKAEKKHRFAVFIPARNEAQSIKDTIECLKNQNYPKDSYDIFVMAHNCTDDTAEVSREAGAIVFECFDDEPDHQRVSYALKAYFEEMLANYDVYDAYIRIDADNYVHPDYIENMNDAFDSGAKMARGYNNSKNLTENAISCISGLWTIRDCRFNCQARSALGLSNIASGAGMMFSADIIRENGGWTEMGLCEDADFTLAELNKGYKTEYVKNAILYDDQPTTVRDTFRRNMRMGRGLSYTFRHHGVRSLGRFFKTGKYTYLDMFMTELFIPIAVLCCLWLPFYYIFALTYTGLNDSAECWDVAFNLICSLAGGFIVPFVLQAVLVYFLERKRINAPFRKVLPGILLFPLFMIFYALGICMGVVHKAKWKQVKRSSTAKVSDFKNQFALSAENMDAGVEVLSLPEEEPREEEKEAGEETETEKEERF